MTGENNERKMRNGERGREREGERGSDIAAKTLAHRRLKVQWTNLSLKGELTEREGERERRCHSNRNFREATL